MTDRSSGFLEQEVSPPNQDKNPAGRQMASHPRPSCPCPNHGSQASRVPSMYSPGSSLRLAL
jgi:hypothetical protein